VSLCWIGRKTCHVNKCQSTEVMIFSFMIGLFTTTTTISWPLYMSANWMILLMQSFTPHMPLLTAASAFRRRWYSPQECYLHCLCTLDQFIILMPHGQLVIDCRLNCHRTQLLSVLGLAGICFVYAIHSMKCCCLCSTVWICCLLSFHPKLGTVMI